MGNIFAMRTQYLLPVGAVKSCPCPGEHPGVANLTNVVLIQTPSS